jgi:hypothetical protein
MYDGNEEGLTKVHLHQVRVRSVFNVNKANDGGREEVGVEAIKGKESGDRRRSTYIVKLFLDFVFGLALHESHGAHEDRQLREWKLLDDGTRSGGG